MSRPKKRTKTGRLTKEAAEIVIEMINEGVVEGGLETFGAGVIPAEFEKDLSGDPSGFQPYFIPDAGWFTRRLTFEGLVSRPEDVRHFELESDRKEFKRRWRERYPKEVEPEIKVEPHSESEIKLTYPLFAKSKKNGIVILFTSKDKGICVKSDWSVHALGECHNNWVHATDTDQWHYLTFAEAQVEIFGEKND